MNVCMCVCVCAVMNSGFPIGAGVHTLNCTNFSEMKFLKKMLYDPCPYFCCVLYLCTCVVLSLYLWDSKNSSSPYLE